MSDDVEAIAKAAFDAQPHRHPNGRIPQWECQPDHIKYVFLALARQSLLSSPVTKE